MITLRSRDLTATILPYGATLSGLWLAGYDRSLVLGSPFPEAYRDDLAYCGALVGPVANRVSQAAMEIDGVLCRMPPNEGTTCLHSGPDGLHAREWQVAGHSETEVTLTCSLIHGAGGLPGNRDITARYSLEDDTLSLDIEARTTRTTPINIAHHPYWSLDDTGSVAGHLLRIQAARFLPTQDDLLPTGEIVPVDQTLYDFRAPRNVPTTQTLDANLCLDGGRFEEPRAVAQLIGASGITLDIETTEPGLQVYNGTGLTQQDTRVHHGQTLAPCAGIALEPQEWPDAPNIPAFPDIMLRHDQLYRQVTRYRISK